jgi:hypothetical protein
MEKEEYIDWLEKSYMNNLGPIRKEIKDLVRQSFDLGAKNVNLDNINLGELEKEFPELYETLARGFVSGIRLGTSFKNSNMEDLEQIVKNNPGGLVK